MWRETLISRFVAIYLVNELSRHFLFFSFFTFNIFVYSAVTCIAILFCSSWTEFTDPALIEMCLTPTFYALFGFSAISNNLIHFVCVCSNHPFVTSFNCTSVTENDVHTRRGVDLKPDELLTLSLTVCFRLHTSATSPMGIYVHCPM
jgi:hypothetical protein